MSTTDNPCPIGAVVAYAGVAPSDQEVNGWYLCDGSPLSADKGSALYPVIGLAYGSSGSGSYALPDYRGRFLRGVDAGTGRDPDANARAQPRSDLSTKGNLAPHVGSIQSSALVSHTHTFTRHTGSENTEWEAVVGGSDDCVNDTQQTRTSSVTGLQETRPINQYVDFLIKSDAGSLLAGTVIHYAGALDTMTDTTWLPCDGRSLETASYPALSQAVAAYYGSDYETDFCLPQYAGRFLRGADNGKNLDPDASTRSAPRPDLNQPGASQGVGSVQGHGLLAHTHNYTGHGTDHTLDEENLLNGLTPGGHFQTVNVCSNTSTSSTSNSTGTSTETRPLNLALYPIIATQSTSTLPSGAVVAFAGDIDDPDIDLSGWLPCDGSSLATSDYAALFQALQYAHGGSGSQFCVPDLRGRFVRSVDDAGTSDPGPRGAAASGGNAAGVGSTQGHAFENHTHGMTTHDDYLTVQMSAQSTSLSTSTTQDTTQGAVVTVSGASISSETRPCNIYAYYLIKT